MLCETLWENRGEQTLIAGRLAAAANWNAGNRLTLRGLALPPRYVEPSAPVLAPSVRPARKSKSPGSAQERQACRKAIEEGRDSDERAMDHVVDRLLAELSW